MAPHLVTIVLCKECERNTISNCGLADVDDIISLDTEGPAALRRTLRWAEERSHWRQMHHDSDSQLLASHCSNGSVITDQAGKIRWVNNGFTEITGYTLEDVIGQTPGSVLQGPDTDQATVDSIRNALKKQEGISTEILNYRKNGKAFWMRIEIQPMFNQNGQLTGYIAVESDNTENHIAQRKLKHSSSEPLTAITDSIPAAVFQISLPRDGTLWFNHISKGVASLLGHRAEELIGRPLHNLSSRIHPEDAFPVRASIDRARTCQDEWKCQFRVVLPGRGVRTVIGRAVPISLGGVVHLNGILYQVSPDQKPEEIPFQPAPLST